VRDRADNPLRPPISDARARRRWSLLRPWPDDSEEADLDDPDDGADWIDESEDGPDDDGQDDDGQSDWWPRESDAHVSGRRSSAPERADRNPWRVGARATRAPVWRQALEFSREHVAVVVVAVIVGLVFAVMTFLHSRSEAVPATEVSAASAPTDAPTAGTVSVSPTPDPVVKVHVMGAVINPGVVELPAGARVEDAIEAAGGLRPDADPAQLNLAAVVADGCQIVIGTKDNPKGEINGPGTTAGSPGQAAASASTTLVNINTASQAELETLPGVGPVTAQKIMAWRAQHKFTTIEELQEIDGIGPKTMAQLRPYVCV